MCLMSTASDFGGFTLGHAREQTELPRELHIATESVANLATLLAELAGSEEL